MGQIIKSVCVCQSVSLSVWVSFCALEALRNALYKCSTYLLTYTLTVAFLDDFHQIWHRRKNLPKVKKSSSGVNIAHLFPCFVF